MRRESLHESYHNHACTIVPEIDVLDSDVKGTGCISSLKRWWIGLFLLSSDCERARSFFTSSNGMLIERLRQFRKYPNRIHPMSKFRHFWDCLILHVLIVNKITFRFSSSFLYAQIPMYLFYLGAMLELIIITDIYVNLKTGYIDVKNKRIILDKKQCLINFCSKKLFLHFASATPLHWFLFLKYGANVNCGLCKCNRYICALKIISVFSLFRIYEASNYWTHRIRSKNKLHCYKFLRIAVLGFLTVWQFFDLSEVVILLVFMNNDTVVQDSFIAFRTLVKYHPAYTVYQLKFNFFIHDIHTILRSLLFYNNGSLKVYYLDMITELIAQLLANTFYAWSFLEGYALLSRLLYPKEKLMRKRNNTLSMLRSSQLPHTLCSKVDQYFKFKVAVCDVIERDNELYRCLPEVLKNEAKLDCYMRHMMRIPFFFDWPMHVLEDITLMLHREVYSKNDIVAEALVQGNGLMIVEYGLLAVYSQHYTETGHLIDGDYFGELSLVTDKEVGMSYVVAITPCTILIIEKYAFRMYMQDYHELFFGMEAQMKSKYNDAEVLPRRASTTSQ